MAWMRHVCGRRLKSDYRYSKHIVYNNFPWLASTAPQRKAIEKAAKKILDLRAEYSDASLADLYDPNTMPTDLLKAHENLDQLVEKAYPKKFRDDTDRVAFLLDCYQSLTADLLTEKRTKKSKQH